MRGEILKLNFLIGIVLIFVLSTFLFFTGSAVTSSGGNFTVTPDNVSFNWTWGSIDITSNVNDTFFRIHNVSNTIQPRYFNEDKYSAGDYQGYDSAKILICFTNGMNLTVQNSSSGAYTNVTDPMNQTNSTIYNLIAYQYCPPGYYFGKFNVTRNGTNDYANMSTAVNIPINPNNTFYEPNSTAFVKGTLAANQSLIHSYYLNTSLAENLTGVTINLSGHTQDVDLYLFDSSGNLLERSVGNGTVREEIYRKLPGTPDMWEISIWGNVTSDQNYVANMYFTTLNVTNASNPNQEISSYDFGGLDPENNESNRLNITLSNVDTKLWTDVKERSEVYRVETWNSKNVTGDYYFLVPHFAEKVKTKIEWTGGTRWYVSLNNSNNVFLGNSSEKYKTGNKTDSVQEESIIYSGTISTDNDDLWKLTVGNLSAINGSHYYNVTVYVWYASSSWVSSDYPAAGFNFNSTGSANSSKNVSVRITLPSMNISNGTYEGFLEYYKSSEWNLKVPVSFNVNAGTLLVNDTLGSVSETKYDNTGFNRLGANALMLTLPINNTGGRDIHFANTTSNYTLSKGSYYMNFTVDWPSSPISAGSSSDINVSILMNTSLTSDSTGLYSGWIKLNTTNSSNASSSSYPFKIFTINLNVNLSSTLTVNVTEIAPAFVPQTENASNMTLNITVRLANGSVVSTNEIINQSNFYSVHLKETNISYTTDTTLQNLTNSATGGTWSVVCPTGYNYCRLNGTLLPNIPGGQYYALASASLNTSNMGGAGITILGSGQSSVKTVINDTGISMTERVHRWVNEANPLDEGDSYYYTIYVRNYGPVSIPSTNKANIMFNKGSCEVSVTPITTNTSCMGITPTSSGTSWLIYMPGYVGGTNCSLTWRVTANSVTENQADCYMNIGVATSHANYGNMSGIGVTVHDNATGGTPGGNGDQPQAPQVECDEDSDCADTEQCSSGSCTSITCPSGYVTNHKCYSYADEFLITSYEEKVYVLQGGSNSTKVTVKNQGAYTRTTKFDAIINLTDLTTEVSPTSYTLASGNSGVFTVNFSTTNTTEIGYHKVTLKVYMSGNESIKTTKDITLAIQPLEETKKQINQTYDDLKELFDSLLSQFNQVPPSSETNYTLTNRTYNRLLSILSDIEDNIKAGEYMDAYELLKEANSSLTEFRQQIEQLVFEGSQLPFDMLTLVAILVVIVVIGGFLVYLLLPPKKGFHPTLGYTPRKKISIVEKLKHLFSGVKKLKAGGKDQKTLGEYEKPMPVEKPAPPLPEKPPEKKTYMEGYDRHEESGLSYKKKEMKPKKKWFGK